MKTYGYDYVFALGADAVNAILAKNLAGVTQTIHYTEVDPDSGSTVTVDATLSPWQMVDGGGGTLLNVSLPIASGSLTLTGGALTGTYDLAGVAPEMQVTLGWVGAGDQQAAKGSGDLTHLTFDPDPSAGPDGQGYVVVVQIADPDKHLDQVASAILTQVMAAALYDNRATVAYVFANVNPTPPGLASWLVPAEWQYFVTGSPNVLAFLCMLTGGAAFPAQPSFDTTALQPGANTALLISQAAFFRNVALPAVHAAFPGGSFNVNVTPIGDATITNNGGFDVGSVAASSYSMAPNGAGNGLTVSASGGGPLTFLFGLANLPNASYSWSVTTQNPASYNGTTVVFADDPNPKTYQDHEMPWYDWPLVVVLGITNVVGLVSLIQGLIDNFGDQAQNVGIGTINTGLQAATGGSLVNVDRLVDWTQGAQSLAPTTAGMNEAIYVAGNLSVPSQ